MSELEDLRKENLRLKKENESLKDSPGLAEGGVVMLSSLVLTMELFKPEDLIRVDDLINFLETSKKKIKTLYNL